TFILLGLCFDFGDSSRPSPLRAPLMRKYTGLRVLQAIITLFAISVVVFLLARLTGNPLHLLLPIEAGPEEYERAAVRLGLDRPLWEQYGIFLGDLVRLDFGTSLRTGAPVSELILARLPSSIRLGIGAMLFTLIVAIPLGVVAAARKDTA